MLEDLPETPKQVYEKSHGRDDVFVYKAGPKGVVRAKLIKRGRTGWDTVEFENGNRKNIQRKDGWAQCATEACEIYLEETCRKIADDSRREFLSVDNFRRLKHAISLLEGFDPDSLETTEGEPS